MKVDRNAYEQMNIEQKKVQASKDPWRLRYHLMPPTGWLNDPNGLCQFQGIYHIYYQYSPDDVEGKTKLWGHYTSEDLIHFREQEPVLYEDNRYDERGVYSGSAFVKGDTIHYFYTGNYKLDGDYDYINEGREHNTMHVTSKDGFVMSEKQRLMANSDYPRDMSCHVRDPKILEHEGCYYMVQGARDRMSRGCVLVFQSEDLINWTYSFRIHCDEVFGYMWECPDLFELDGQLFLMICPQGVKQQGIDYASIYQNGYFPITIDFDKKSYKLGDFYELDRGFDFYAPQSFEDESGRRILIPWMGLPDIDYTNPTVDHGWQHALGMPRVLSRKGTRILQQPVEEMKQLRKEGMQTTVEGWNSLHVQETVFEFNLDLIQEGDVDICLRNQTHLCYQTDTKICTLRMGKEGCGRDERRVQLEGLYRLQIFSDTSSLEIFINGGEESFTTRIYGEDDEIRIINAPAESVISYYPLTGYVID